MSPRFTFWSLSLRVLPAILLGATLSAGLTPRVAFAAECADHLRSELPKIEKLQVRAVQFPIRGGTSEARFLADIESYVKQAASKGQNLVVFPELPILDLLKTHALAEQGDELRILARDFTPRYFQNSRDLSRKYGVSILVGSAPREVDGAIRNTALFVQPNGKSVLQDKLFLTPDEKIWGWAPGNELKVFETPWGRTTILICYDAQSPFLSSALAPHAPEVILIPSMTGEKGLHRVRWAAQARAVEHHAYVVVTGTVTAREVQGGVFSGQAVLLTPQETGFEGRIAQGPRDRPASVTGELDMRKLERSRAETGLYSARDQLFRDATISVSAEDLTAMPVDP